MDQAYYIHAGTEAAPGHTTFLSGATPSVNGIIANEWWDRAAERRLSPACRTRPRKTIGGVPGEVGASPINLLVGTLGDEIRKQGKRIEDHRHIVQGPGCDSSLLRPFSWTAPTWWDTNSNTWVSSTFYMKQLLGLGCRYQSRAARFARSIAGPLVPSECRQTGQTILHDGGGQRHGTRFAPLLMATPWGNELIERICGTRADSGKPGGITKEQNLLTVSFSSNDALLATR